MPRSLPAEGGRDLFPNASPEVEVSATGQTVAGNLVPSRSRPEMDLPV